MVGNRGFEGEMGTQTSESLRPRKNKIGPKTGKADAEDTNLLITSAHTTGGVPHKEGTSITTIG